MKKIHLNIVTQTLCILGKDKNFLCIFKNYKYLKRAQKYQSE